VVSAAEFIGIKFKHINPAKDFDWHDKSCQTAVHRAIPNQNNLFWILARQKLLNVFVCCIQTMVCFFF
jgi:hypothetical protein